MTKFTPIKDQYSRARGGRSRFLNIYCAHCGSHVLLYQKDGPGPLKRLYIDRIFAPTQITQFKDRPTEKIPNLVCDRCNRMIGMPAVYREENRKIYLLFSYSFMKRITKGIYPPEIKKVNP